jgi:RNA polymerase sigma-70 factor (ECF subfamily)
LGEAVNRATGGNERFHILFAQYHQEVQAYCARRLPVHDANEVAAEVFTVAWRRIADVPGGDESLPWLYGVARNAIRNHRRGAIRRLRLVAKAGSIVDAQPDGPETLAIRSAEIDEVSAALAALRDDDQELLRLKAWEQISNQAIAEVLGISVQAVESRYARAIARLAKKLPPKNSKFGNSPPLKRKGGEAV